MFLIWSHCCFSGSFIRLVFTTPDLSDEQKEKINEILTRQIQVYMKHHKLSTPDGVGVFIEYVMKAYNLALESVEVGSLIIKVQCPTLESLESLWNDYCSGHLNEVAERFLVTNEIKKKLNLETVRLKTTIEEENYLTCKKALMEKSRKFFLEWKTIICSPLRAIYLNMFQIL